MTGDPIHDIISSSFLLPETGEPVACAVESLVIQPSLDGAERDLLGGLGFRQGLAIVCDINTYEALGERITSALPDAASVILEAPAADDTTINELADRTRHAETLIAVGSGTLNDLVKYLSYQRRRPYAVFATAPSMNGYVTATASISRGGEKLSLPATPPKGVFFDLGVLASAPGRLISAGVGDCLCRSTAECDWRLSHHLIGTDFLDTPFTIQADDEARLLGHLQKLEKRDLQAVETLVRLLVLGGFGMMIAGSSQPGSQGEHLISHYVDMVAKPHPGSLHGEQVGLATRTMATLQEHMLAFDEPPRLFETIIDVEDMKARFGRWGGASAAALARKALTGERLRDQNERLIERWPLISADLKARSLPLAVLEQALDLADVPADPSDLGITPAFYRQSVLHARELRDRFTMLDLAADAGLLEAFVDRQILGD